jgi:hypothetical protein
MTIHLDEPIERLLRAEAERQQTTPDALAAQLLARGLALRLPKKRDLSHLAGTWSDAEAEAFLADLAIFERIDEQPWKDPLEPRAG